MNLTYEEYLAPLRKQLDHVDQGLLGLLSVRSDLVKHVGRLKEQFGKPLQASDREAAMFKKLGDRCGELGLDEGYALELWSLIIWNSKIMECREANRDTFMNKEPVDPAILRSNLLRLTAGVATQYDAYCNGPGTNAIRAYRDREEHAYKRCFSDPNMDRNLALDLGCASGQFTRYLSQDFQSVQAFDVSPDMIEEACNLGSCGTHVTFQVHDLEHGIPVTDSSVSFVIANFGVASELGSRLLPELKRVLKPGGKALLSFYNEMALVNHWFYPWPSTVHARNNPFNNTVEVWANGSVYVVQGKAETVANLQLQCRVNGLEPEFWETYPTLQSVLPSVFFQEPMFENFIGMAQEIDNHLARSISGINRGMYILTVVTKKK